MELDSVRSIEVFGNGSYRRVDPANVVDPTAAVIIDDDAIEISLQETEVSCRSAGIPR